VAEADGTTPLHWVVQANDAEMVQLLIWAGANAKTANRLGVTPLAVAALNGNATIIEILVKAGADPNAAGPAGETPLMTAARTGNADAIDRLLRLGARADTREPTEDGTALMWAAAEDHSDAIETLILHGADPNARSKVRVPPEWKWIGFQGMVSTALPRGGWSSLMYAARQGSFQAAEALVEAGADLDLQDADGSTALIIAIINAHFDLARLLLEWGADPNVTDEHGMGPLYAAVDMNSLAPMLMRPAPKLTDVLDSVGLVQLLLAKGANPDARLKKPILGRHHDSGDASMGEGTTPLMRAAKGTAVPVVRLLLDAGADPTLTQKDYTNALMIAAAGTRSTSFGTAGFQVTEEGAIEAIKLCLEHGADVNAFNAAGQTPMHIAAARGADKIVKFLAERGAAVDLKNKRGRTPLDLALGVGRPRGANGTATLITHQSTAQLLRQLGGTASVASPNPTR
jgi:ankyrin repeat protein